MPCEERLERGKEAKVRRMRSGEQYIRVTPSRQRHEWQPHTAQSFHVRVHCTFFSFARQIRIGNLRAAHSQWDLKRIQPNACKRPAVCSHTAYGTVSRIGGVGELGGDSLVALRRILMHEGTCSGRRLYLRGLNKLITTARTDGLRLRI